MATKMQIDNCLFGIEFEEGAWRPVGTKCPKAFKDLRFETKREALLHFVDHAESRKKNILLALGKCTVVEIW